MDLTFFPARAKWRSSQSPRRGVPWLCLTGADIVRDGVICMVRRRTARRVGVDENSLRKCIRPLSGELMMIRACLSLLSATVVKDLVTPQVFRHVV